MAADWVDASRTSRHAEELNAKCAVIFAGACRRQDSAFSAPLRFKREAGILGASRILVAVIQDAGFSRQWARNVDRAADWRLKTLLDDQAAKLDRASLCRRWIQVEQRYADSREASRRRDFHASGSSRFTAETGLMVLAPNSLIS
ncbi:hypothetical protein CA85_24850 [Allorhodopirellula solitaria]|uniref:Uncharacterized protein n=1 Tax=Allorhodopirellula solitaria TaxID=2527987 RepID=A0A5C5XUZ7_9BACT|nr:hypothetical protein CA85_24850 [Allorhodopirellula solitaria]